MSELPVEEARQRLRAIELEENVRILYACESGSRAWGFASPDSDYDVRFLYAHPRDWYLQIDEGRDVIERAPDGVWDVNGWDIRKALQLLCKSNPALSEWLRSPYVYCEASLSVRMMQTELNAAYYSRNAAMYHYYHMARGNAFKYVLGQRAGKLQVQRKKYLYVLRPLFACRWIECFEAPPPPVHFPDLFRWAAVEGGAAISDEFQDAVETLLLEKQQAAELGWSDADPVLGRYIEQELERYDCGMAEMVRRVRAERPIDTTPLNRVFRMALSEAT